MSEQHRQEIPEEHHVRRVGGWLPADHRVHREWLDGLIEDASQNPQKFHPAIKELQDLVHGNARIYMLMQGMFDEVPRKKRYAHDPTGSKQVRDLPHMLVLLNHILTKAPHWTTRSEKVGLVGLPILAVLDWPMGTPSGFAAFQDPEINRALKKVLNAWGEFLQSEESAKQVIHAQRGGWLGSTAKQDLETVANRAGGQSASFEEHFLCDPSRGDLGFKSWDDFFTRQFREGMRPVAAPNDDKVIANACESKPYSVSKNIRLRDKFWAKGQPYSVQDMLGQDSHAEQFVGGTVYQAFLSALSYHRWHAPVSGRIVKAFVAPGTYYSEPLWETLGDPKGKTVAIDTLNEVHSQTYIAHVAARAIILIEASHPGIGLMAFVGIGMSEVSTCEITVKEGQHVQKGDEIGMFHFGGSTHCLVFGPKVKVEGFPTAGREANVPVRSQLAVLKN